MGQQEGQAVSPGATIQAVAAPGELPPPTLGTSADPAPPPAANVVPAVPPLGTVMVITPPMRPELPYKPPMRPELPYSISVGTILLYENFARYREGVATDWGLNSTIKAGVDGHKWLAAFIEGTYPVTLNIRLPSEFYWECRYAVQMPEVTRGVLGWWKEPVTSRIAFVGDRGARYAIEWMIRCGVDLTLRDPLASLHARKYYHTVTLPGGRPVKSASPNRPACCGSIATRA